MANNKPNTIYYGNTVDASGTSGYSGSSYKAVGQFTEEVNSATEYQVKVYADVYFNQYTGHTSSAMYISKLNTKIGDFDFVQVSTTPIYSPTTGTSTNGPWSYLESKITKTKEKQTYYVEISTTNTPGGWSDITLTIEVPAKTSYAVTYNTNTTDTVTNMPDNQTKWYGEALTLNSATIPKRTGYSFGGWWTNSNGTGTLYGSTNTNYTTNAALTLYAYWVANTYDVKYEKNSTQGGTFTDSTVGGMPSNQTKTYNVSLALNTATKPTKSSTTSTGYKVICYPNGGTNASSTLTQTNTYNYTFAKWYTTSSGSGGTNYGSSAKTYSTNASLTLYAQWTRALTSGAVTLPAAFTKASTTTSYTITCKPNGGSGDDKTATQTNTITYTFNKWNTNSAGTGSSYAAKSSFTPAANTSLYATWTSTFTSGSTKLPTAPTKASTSTSYSIICNPNGGTSPSSASTLTQNNVITYAFSNWNTASNGTGTSRNANSTAYTFTGNTTLYAIWASTLTLGSVKLPSTFTKANTTANGYTVTCSFNGNGQASSALTQINTTTYTFNKWNTNSAGTGSNYNAATSYSFNAATSLYATWTSSLSKGKVTLPTVNARTGYTFKGWASTSTGTTAAYTDKQTFEPAKSMTVYAIWSANPYNITYLSNAPTTNAVSGMPAAQIKYHDTNLTLSTAVPTTTGYTFLKWNTNSAGTGTNYSAGATYSTNASASLYAQWSIWQYAITYSKNTTDTVTSMPTNQTKNWNSAITLTNSTPARTGYDYKGWASTSTGAVVYKPGSQYNINASISLYAVWSEKTYSITYNGNSTNGGAFPNSEVLNVPAAQTKKYFTNLTLSTSKPTKAQTTSNGYKVTFSVNGDGGTVSPTSSTAVDTYTYSFAKWYTSSNGTGTGYTAGATFSTNAVTTLYANWTSSKSLGAVTLPTPTRIGFTFLGWNSVSTASTGSSAGISYTPTANITLYAIWRANLTDGYVLRATNNSFTWANLISNQTDSNSTLYIAGGQYNGWSVDASGYVTCFGSRIKRGTASVKGTDKPIRGATYTYYLS